MGTDNAHAHRLGPRLTVAEADALRGALEAALAAGCEELDAAEVQRVDAAGLQVLLAAQVAARDRGSPIAWRSPSEALVEAAAACGLTERLGV